MVATAGAAPTVAEASAEDSADLEAEWVADSVEAVPVEAGETNDY